MRFLRSRCHDRRFPAIGLNCGCRSPFHGQVPARNGTNLAGGRSARDDRRTLPPEARRADDPRRRLETARRAAVGLHRRWHQARLSRDDAPRPASGNDGNPPVFNDRGLAAAGRTATGRSHCRAPSAARLRRSFDGNARNQTARLLHWRWHRHLGNAALYEFQPERTSRFSRCRPPFSRYLRTLRNFQRSARAIILCDRRSRGFPTKLPGICGEGSVLAIVGLYPL